MSLVNQKEIDRNEDLLFALDLLAYCVRAYGRNPSEDMAAHLNYWDEQVEKLKRWLKATSKWAG